MHIVYNINLQKLCILLDGKHLKKYQILTKTTTVHEIYEIYQQMIFYDSSMYLTALLKKVTGLYVFNPLTVVLPINQPSVFGRCR